MRLIKTHLRNTCQFPELQVDFGLGLIGVEGRNGRGKSNLLNVGGYANLTNDYRRTNGTQAQCIRRGAGPSDPSVYQSWWEHNGTRFSIKRDLRRKTHELKIDGKDGTLTSSNDIQNWLESILGIKRQVIDNYVFVNQMEMFNFITQTDAERSETFSHLCGTAYMQKIYDSIGERIKADLPLSADIIDNSDELRQQIGESKKKRRAAKKSLEEFKPQLLPKEKVKSLKDLVTKRRDYRRLRKELETAKALQVTRRTEWETAAAAVLKASEAISTAQELMLTAKESADKAQSLLKAYNELAKKHRDIETNDANITKLKKPKKPTEPEDYGNKAACIEKLADLRSELKRAQAAIHTFEKNGKAVCSECGTEACDVDLTKFHAINESHHDLIATLRDKVNAFEAYEGDAVDYKTDLATYKEKLAGYERKKTELGEKPELPEKVSADAVAVLVRKHTDAETALTTARATDRKAAQTVAAAKTRFDETTANVKDLKTKTAASKVDKKEAIAAKKALELHQGAAAQVAVFRERITNATDEIARIEKQLADLDAAKARTRVVRAWLRDLETMQNDVFHRSKLPQLVNEDALDSLLDRVNETLAEAFGDPFSVKVGKNLAFTAIKPDGEEPALRLSGGEKAVLAIAFRMAINSIFAAEIGMMVLDEPTYGLDGENIDCLREALVALAAYSRKRGTQIIIVTHDVRLAPAYDKVIRL